MKQNGDQLFSMVQLKMTVNERSLVEMMQVHKNCLEIIIKITHNLIKWIYYHRKRLRKNMSQLKKQLSREKIKSFMERAPISMVQVRKVMEHWWPIQLTGETFNRLTLTKLLNLKNLTTLVMGLKIENIRIYSLIFSLVKVLKIEQLTIRILKKLLLVQPQIGLPKVDNLK
jgi:hypothetical protein